MLRKGLVALTAASALVLAGCASAPSTVIDHSVVSVGVDVPYTGVGPASPDASALDLAVGAATLAGFSHLDAEGRSVPDAGFGRITVVSQEPFVVRYTVADGLAWSDGVGIDGVDLMLDWVARAHPYAGVRFGSLADSALAGARSVSLSSDRKSLDIEFSAEPASWREAFRAPLPAHAIAARAFDSSSPEAAKDAVVAAVAAAADGDRAALADLATAWASAFELDEPAPPASGPYEIASASAGHIELVVNDRYSGTRSPTYAAVELWDLGAPAAAVQALSIGELDIVQVAPSDELRAVLGRISADRRLLGPADAPTLLVGWFHRDVDHVDPGPTELGALWNPWAWAPYVPPEI